MQKLNEVEIMKSVIDAVSSLDIDNLLHAVDKIISDITLADSTGIYTFDKSGASVILRASKIHFDCVGKLKMHLGQGITGWVAQHGKSVIIEQGAPDDIRFARIADLPDDLYEAFLSIPILSGNVVVGVINVKYKNKHKYPPNQIKMVEMIAKLIGRSIEHAVLLEETQTLKNALATQKAVNCAKGILIKKYNISENEAYQLLRKQAMNKRLSMIEVAEALISTQELIDK